MTRRLAGAYWLGRLAWQRDGKQGSAAGPAAHRDGTTVGLGNPLGDRETQPGSGTLSRARAGRVGPPEAVEYMREITRRNPDSRVTHGQGHRIALIGQAQGDLAASGSVLDRVGDQVEQEL